MANSTKETKIVQIINDITDLTESQKQRLLLKEISQQNLLAFLNTYITKIAQQSEFKNKIEKLLHDKLDNDEDVPYGVLIKLYEIATQNEVAQVTPVLKILESSAKQPDVVIQQDIQQKENNNDKPISKNDLSPDEMRNVKKLLSILQDLEQTEILKK